MKIKNFMPFLLIFLNLAAFGQVNPLSNLTDNIQDNGSKPCVRKCYEISGNSISFASVKCKIMGNHGPEPVSAEISSDPNAPIKITLAAGQRAELGFNYTFTGSGYLHIELKLTGNKDVDVELTNTEMPWSGIDTRELTPGSNTLKCNFKNYSDKDAEAIVYFTGSLDAGEGNTAIVSNVHVTPLN